MNEGRKICSVQRAAFSVQRAAWGVERAAVSLICKFLCYYLYLCCMKAEFNVTLLLPPNIVWKLILGSTEKCYRHIDNICFCRRCRLGGGRLIINGEDEEYVRKKERLGYINDIIYVTGSQKGEYQLQFRVKTRAATLFFSGRRNSFIGGSEFFTVVGGLLWLTPKNIPIGDIHGGVIITTTPDRKIPGLPSRVKYVLKE